ncbi:MAG TPA: GNAT family N-acetyltransferase [Flavobacteriales bacterium]|nr:GNAT family N-acetyltransferase [Flavobacteriales bacterium]
MEPRFTSDPAELDTAFIHRFITGSYWARGRSMADMERCIAHSLNFGMFLGPEPIGYARMVTDHTVFGYLMDVFIDPGHRGRGHGARLLQHVLSHPDVARLHTVRLATRDAQGLYARFGFLPSTEATGLMELKRPGAYGH